MGREIRKVAKGWEHPKRENKYTGKLEYQPMYDKSFKEASNEWVKGFIDWLNGGRESNKLDGEDFEYWEWEGMPPEDREYYRPIWSPEEMTHIQMYETVSEGTPVSPVFAIKEQLIDYLVKNGDYWDQERGERGWNLESAESFVADEWCPSFILTVPAKDSNEQH